MPSPPDPFIDPARAKHAQIKAAVLEGIAASEAEETYSHHEVWAEAQAPLDAIVESRDEDNVNDDR